MPEMQEGFMSFDLDLRLAEVVTPVMDRHRGRRLEFMRKKLFMDQKQLAERFGVTQQTISRLERGQIPVARIPVSLGSFYRVFGVLVNHILFGDEQFNYNEINGLYWREKDKKKGNRVPRKPYHKKLRWR